MILYGGILIKLKEEFEKLIEFNFDISKETKEKTKNENEKDRASKTVVGCRPIRLLYYLTFPVHVQNLRYKACY